MSSSFRKTFKTLLLLLSACALESVYAQTTEQGAQEGLRRQEEREREQQQQLQPQANVLTPPTEPEISFSTLELPDETPCFKIEHIQINGAKDWHFIGLTRPLDPFIGRCIGVEGVRRIAAALDAKLIQSGYVTTRVTLPEQNLAEGTLNLQLNIGRISALRMVQAAAPAQPATPSAAPVVPQSDDSWGIWHNAFPTSAGRILNLRDLEQGVEQMKRLSSQNVGTRIEPGEEPDTSVIVIERQSAPWWQRFHGGLSVDNSGSATLGRTQASGNLSWENPLGLNDILSASVNGNAEQPDPDHRSQSASVNYNIPFGYHTLSASYSRSRYAQYVQGTTAHFLSSGKSETTQARWDFIATRESSSKLGLYSSLSTRSSHSYLDDIELTVQRSRTANLEFGSNYHILFGQSSLNLDISYRLGLGQFGATPDYPSENSNGLTRRPRLWSFSGSFGHPFDISGQAFQYSLSVRGQQTRNLTTSNDQFSIGNRYSVRGFDGDAVLLAESGVTLRNDFSTSVSLIEGLSSSVYFALDYGHVWGKSAKNLVGQNLAGTALGFRGRYAGLQIDLSLGTPIYKPTHFQTMWWNPYLSATYSF